MEMDTLVQLIHNLGLEQGFYIWALILAGREIRRLFYARLKEKDQLTAAKENNIRLLKLELDRCQLQLRNLFHDRQNTKNDSC